SVRAGALALFQGHGEAELAAAADLALEPQAAAHQLHQLPGQGQPEAGALVAAAAAVLDLRELLEDARLLVARDAEAVVANGDHRVPPAPLGLHRHAAALGRELDGV